MTTTAALTSKASLSPTSSPRPAVIPNIGSLPVTEVINGQALQGPEKSSTGAMQVVQRQQTQPAAASTLSPSRVNTSVAEKETGMTAATSSSSTSSVQPAVAPSLGSDSIKDISDLEMILVGVANLEFIDILTPIPDSDKVQAGQEVNRILGMMNSHFKALLEHSDNLGLWLEQESQKLFHRKYHPFAASCFLMTHIGQAAGIQPHLDPALVAEWKVNYQQCVALLKKHRLDRYNQTEFPFSENSKLAIVYAKMLAADVAENPRHKDQIMASLQSSVQNPRSAEAKSKEMGIDTAPIQGVITAQIQSLLSFFQELDRVLKRHPHDAAAVEAWLNTESSKPTYSAPFYHSQDLFVSISILKRDIPEFDVPANAPELKSIFDHCCLRLITLGLQRYVDENPSTQKVEPLRAYARCHQEKLQQELSGSVKVLKALAAELKRLPAGDQARNSNRETIDRWFVNFEAQDDFSSFVYSTMQYINRASFEGVLDGAMLHEFRTLYSFCRDQLMLLGLNKYLEGMLSTSPQRAQNATSSTVPKKALSDTERFEREMTFFRGMIRQDGKAVLQWLKDNSPESDYPLLWAKKRMSQLSRFRGTVQMDLRREWKMCADTCLERVPVDLGQIPADASPELKAFLAQG